MLIDIVRYKTAEPKQVLYFVANREIKTGEELIWHYNDQSRYIKKQLDLIHQFQNGNLNSKIR